MPNLIEINPKIKHSPILETIVSICIPGTIIILSILFLKLTIVSPIYVDYFLPIVIALSAISYLYFKKIPLASIGIRRKGSNQSLLYSIILIIIFLIYGIFSYHLKLNLENTALKVFLKGLYYIFVIALGEEIWVRGIVFNFLEKLKGGNFALIISSLIFSAFHMRHGMDAIFFALIFGLCFGFVRLKTKNILGLILSHGIFILAVTDLLI